MRVGIDRDTGKMLSGWEHCQNSIITILTTELGSRVQRRGFGVNLPEMIDKPQNEEWVLKAYVEIAKALEPRIVEGRQYGEPGFVLINVSVDASVPGVVTFSLRGVYFDNGHLGDYSNPVEKFFSFTP